MNEKVTCQKCNELILSRTAEKTGGICMACVQGIRESIEQSKKHYRKLKEYDPDRELWLHLVKRVNTDENGFATLTAEEKLYFVLVLFEGEVYNGGMHQFFSNSSGEYYAEVVEGLTEIKAFESLTLLKRAAMVLFGETEPPKDREQRWSAMPEFPEDDDEQRPVWDLELDEIDHDFHQDPDKLGELLDAYAETTGLIRPFKLKKH